MTGMTGDTVIYVLVLVLLAFIAGQGLLMTFQTDAARFIPKHGCCLSGMGVMTGKAASLLINHGQMVVGQQIVILHLFVTFKAGFTADHLARLVAITAIIAEGFMNKFAHDGFLITAMGIMAACTIAGDRHAKLMLALDLFLLVTSRAKLITLLGKEIVIGAAMRQMTG
jgi:hypothetical protein